MTRPPPGQVEPSVRPHRTPTREEVEALMKRCQIGVGGRHAFDQAHDIMADCYGTLGLLMQCVEFYRGTTCSPNAESTGSQ